MSNTVLFVDDEEQILNSINRLFLDKDVHILQANNAEEALEILDRENVAVIVSDNQMPGMKGIELFSRANDVSPQTLKILMTAHADLSDAVDAINRGDAFRFITKPWDEKSFLDTVNEAVMHHQFIQMIRQGDELTLHSLAQIVELRDPYTLGHSDRVAILSLEIASKMHLDDKIKEAINVGSILHDCGKIGVSDHILHKKGQLSNNEYEIIKNHPRWGADIAIQANLSEMIINIIRYHHEHYDGNGYPSRLNANDIPLEARIVTVADVYDALTSDRCYRAKHTQEKSLEIMKLMKGIVFDPEILDIFILNCPENL